MAKHTIVKRVAEAKHSAVCWALEHWSAEHIITYEVMINN